MEAPSTMDKKAVVRGPQLPFKNGQEASGKDFGSKKNGGQYARKREVDKQEACRQPYPSRGGRSGQRYVRSREKTSGQIETSLASSEAGSLYNSGKKKQDITHLMNWWGPEPGGRNLQRHYCGWGGQGSRAKRSWFHLPKYNKEHYLQANCQFVVGDAQNYSAYYSDPDRLVEWDLVEEVRMHVSAFPSCPICLYPPIAAKVTRCGHIYCYSCILHYLALSDSKWRKCPICYEAVIKDDLKSVVAVVHKDYSMGEEIELHLMCRARNSLVAVPVASLLTSSSTAEQAGYLGSYSDAAPYTRLLIATKMEVINHIIEREKYALMAQLADEGDQPEACFIEEALSLVRLREESLQLPVKELEAVSLSTELSDDCTEGSPSGSPTGTELPAVKKISPEESVGLLSQMTPSGGQSGKNTPKAVFYFYQEKSGAHTYLHALNIQMLVHEYGALEKCPPVIKAKILEKESMTMTEDTRKRLRYLQHLSISCPFEVVEVALGYPTISQLTMVEFQEQVEARRKKRNKRAREERRIEKRIQLQEDRMMGRTRGASIKIESFKHFPVFSLPSSPPDDSYIIPNTEDNENVALDEGNIVRSLDHGFAESPPSSSFGLSFAEMIREQKAQQATWPTIGKNESQVASAGAGPKSSLLQVAGGDAELLAERSTKGRERRDTSCSEDDLEEFAVPPDYKDAFCDAFAVALDAATRKKAQINPVESSNLSGGHKGKKKKQKRMLLLSSGGL